MTAEAIGRPMNGQDFLASVDGYKGKPSFSIWAKVVFIKEQCISY